MMSGVMGPGWTAARDALQRAGRSPEGRPGGALERARRKEAVVLRGEGLDALARETGQPAGRISAWREEFLAAGREGVKSDQADAATAFDDNGTGTTTK